MWGALPLTGNRATVLRPVGQLRPTRPPPLCPRSVGARACRASISTPSPGPLRQLSATRNRRSLHLDTTLDSGDADGYFSLIFRDQQFRPGRSVVLDSRSLRARVVAAGGLLLGVTLLLFLSLKAEFLRTTRRERRRVDEALRGAEDGRALIGLLCEGRRARRQRRASGLRLRCARLRRALSLRRSAGRLCGRGLLPGLPQGVASGVPVGRRLRT